MSALDLVSAGGMARLGFALLLVAGLVGGGLVIRAVVQRRRAIMIDSVRLAPSTDWRPYLITFGGPGCSAYRVQREIVQRLRATWHGGFAVEEIDAALSPLARRLGIVTVPATVVAAPSGWVVAINVGLTDAGRLATQLAAAETGRSPQHQRGAVHDRDTHASSHAA